MDVDEPLEVLLVEDSPYDVKLTLRALRDHGADRVHVVHDGAEALDFIFATGTYAARDVGNQPKVILLDLKLPKVNGIEVLRQVREDPRTTTQPVVLLTSSADRRDIDAAYGLHVNSYIVKPADFTRFIEVIRELSRYWMDLNRPPSRQAARA